MLGKNFSRIKYLLFLALFLVVPAKAWAGLFAGTDFASFQLVYFWDLRARDSFLQVTNTSPLPVVVHVQIFNAGAGCTEIDFYDDYTGNDTHVYDLRGLTRNSGVPINVALPDGGFGVAVVTVVTGEFGPATFDPVLTGNFRVIDGGGYEYRANATGIFNILTFADFNFPNTLNFNNVAGANASDLVGITLDNIGTGFIEVIASAPFITFDIDIYDADENPISCDDFTFSCTPTNFDVGINDALPNSRGAASVCPGNFDTTGFLRMVPEFAFSDFDFFVGYIGLNNGGSTGSMDTWWITFFNDQFLNNETATSQ